MPSGSRQHCGSFDRPRIERFRNDQEVGRLLKGLSAETDGVLVRLGRGADFPAAWTLFAVGGYGRGELQPHSDVDLLLLTAVAPDPQQVGRIERFIGACWDAGLEISHSVRTPAQCAEEALADITVMTSLLERRRLAGSRRLAAELASTMQGLLVPATFLRDKMLEMRQRHQKYEDTPYSLEPNCKESPGALRDLQVIGWVTRAAGLGLGWNSPGPSGRHRAARGAAAAAP
jgi:[protein-PII] uridylyltransferase